MDFRLDGTADYLERPVSAVPGRVDQTKDGPGFGLVGLPLCDRPVCPAERRTHQGGKGDITHVFRPESPEGCILQPDFIVIAETDRVTKPASQSPLGLALAFFKPSRREGCGLNFRGEELVECLQRGWRILSG